MNIALDYDNTYTLDPIAWQDMLETFIARGHKVYLVTSRHAKKDQLPFGDAVVLSQLTEEFIYCNGKAKMQTCKDRNIDIDVWIDDHPDTVNKDHEWDDKELKRWREHRDKVNG